MKHRKDFCPLCYSGIRGRQCYKGHAAYRKPPRPWRDAAMGLPRKRGSVDVEKSQYDADPTAEIVGKFPLLGEFLTLQRWEDGEERVLGTLMVVCRDGFWKGWLNDKESGQTCWVSFSTFQDLMDGIEMGLGTDTLPWRRVTAPEQQKGKGGVQRSK